MSDLAKGLQMQEWGKVSKRWLLEEVVKIQHARRERLLEMLRQQEATEKAMWDRLYATASDEDHRDSIADQSALIDMDLASAADLLMVGNYHWFENCAKLSLCQGFDVPAATAFGLSSLKTLCAEFARRRCPLDAVPGYATIDLLRVFANSWKHNGSSPSDELTTNLGLAKERRVGYLECNDIAIVLSQRLGAVGSEPLAIAEASARVVKQYLDNLRERIPE